MSITNQGVTDAGTNNPTYTNTYQYDGFNRLTNAQSVGGGLLPPLFPTGSYDFDGIGRMTTRHIGTTTNNYSYTNSAHIDAPTAYGSIGNMNTYSYDAAGNQTQG